MITTLVQIKLSETLSLNKAQDIFAATAPKYIEVQRMERPLEAYICGNREKPQKCFTQKNGKDLFFKSMDRNRL